MNSSVKITERSWYEKTFTEEQIIKIVAEHEAGQSVADVCRKHGPHINTLYKWRRKYAGLSVNEVQRLHVFEEENRRLKQIVADQASDIVVLKDIQKKVLKPEMMRPVTGEVIANFGLSERHACAITGMNRSSYRCECKNSDDDGLREK